MSEIKSTIYTVDPTTGDIYEENRKTLGSYLSSRTNRSDAYTTPYADSVNLQGGGNPGSGIGYGYLPPRPNSIIVTSNTSEITADSSTQLPTVVQDRFAYPDALNRHTQQAYSSTSDDSLRLIEKLEPSSGRSSGELPPNNLLSNRGNESFPGDLGVPETVKTKIRSAVLMKNRFNEEGRFTKKTYSDSSPRVQDPGESLFRSHVESELGVSRDSRLPAELRPTFSGATNTSSDGEGAPVSAYKLMRDRGLISVLNASGYKIGSYSNFEGREDAPDSIGNRYVFIAGSLVDTSTGGKVVDMSQVTPAVNMFDPPIEDPDMGNPETKINHKSYGVLNNYLDRFSGGGSDRAVVVALLLYASLFVAIAVVAFIFTLIGGLERPDAKESILPLGAERGAPFGNLFSEGSFVENIQITLAKLLNIKLPYETGFGRYFLNAIEGAASLIGLNIDDFGGDAATLATGLSGLVEVVLNLAFASGYYLTLIRAICRDLSLIGQAANDIGSPLGFVDFINKLRDSRIVRVTDSCASIGEKNRTKRKNSNEFGLLSRFEPRDDPNESASNTAHSRVSRSRAMKGKKDLAWNQREISRTNLEMITTDYVRLSSYKAANGTGKISARTTEVLVESQVGRIADDLREIYENRLESEYVPFYFHDLRTNEIFSFNAFLENLSDGFDVAYTQSTGFGRLDPVQIYGGTTRSISFSFFVVATHKNDHDEMWYLINRLVNMCYPQWSEGTILDDGKNKFIQPFSQVIAASPMIRLRIGDVISSNYDRFGLAKLFGLGKSDAKLAETTLKDPAAQDTDNIVSRSTIEKYLKVPSDLEQVRLKNVTLALSLTKPTIKYKFSTDRGAMYFANAADLAAFANGGPNLDKFKHQPWISPPRKADSPYLIDGKVIAVLYQNGTVSSDAALLLVEASNLQWVDGTGAYYEEGQNQIPYPEFKYQVVKLEEVLSVEAESLYGLGAGINEETQADQRINDFLNPETNAIVRSFEGASGGKGLAGFITKLGLDWGESTWETDRGSRAPIWVKLDVSFSPIHDIQMGLAYDGDQRAVAYPVGNTVRDRFFPNRK